MTVFLGSIEVSNQLRKDLKGNLISKLLKPGIDLWH